MLAETKKYYSLPTHVSRSITYHIGICVGVKWILARVDHSVDDNVKSGWVKTLISEKTGNRWITAINIHES